MSGAKASRLRASRARASEARASKARWMGEEHHHPNFYDFFSKSDSSLYLYRASMPGKYFYENMFHIGHGKPCPTLLPFLYFMGSQDELIAKKTYR